MTAPKVERGVFEIVLPESGRFVSVRPFKWYDALVGSTAGHMALPVLAARCATLDGETLTPDQWAEIDLDDIAPLANELARRINAACQKKGAA